MSISVADILRQHGFVPSVPTDREHLGNAETQAQSHVPAVPSVPTQKHKGENETRKPATDVRIIRARLLELAAAAYMDAKPVRALPDSLLRDCNGMADDALRALLSMLRDDADRRAGRAPEGDTAPIMCQSCGPVFVHPTIAAVLPVVDGWARALGCPWCFIRKAGLYVPRPPIASDACTHWHADKISPPAGRGQCACGSFWPGQRHTCDQYQPRGNL